MNPFTRSYTDKYIYDDNGSLDAYLAEIGDTPLLTAEEERQIGMQLQAAERDNEGKLIHQADKDARNRMIALNVRLVVAVAKGYRSDPSYMMLDRIQEGNIGLMKAVDRFDATKGYKFSTYATWWIRQAIGRAYDERHTLIHKPTYIHTATNAMKRLIRTHTQITGVEPTIEEIALAMNKTPDYIRSLQEWDKSVASLDAHLDNTDELTLSDMLIDEEDCYERANTTSDLGEAIEHAFTVLTEREQAVLRLRFGFDGPTHTLEAIATKMHITRERIRQIEAVAKNKLYKPLQNTQRAG
jgi:RNA polymerase primary sigma factor